MFRRGNSVLNDWFWSTLLKTIYPRYCKVRTICSQNCFFKFDLNIFDHSSVQRSKGKPDRAIEAFPSLLEYKSLLMLVGANRKSVLYYQLQTIIFQTNLFQTFLLLKDELFCTAAHACPSVFLDYTRAALLCEHVHIARLLWYLEVTNDYSSR